MIPLRTSIASPGWAPVVWFLLVGNVVLFLLGRSLPVEAYRSFLYEFALVPARYTFPEMAREAGLDPFNTLPLVTNIFLHNGWMHLTVNMWTLWLFGRALEGRLGAVRFGLFYLACGVLASVAHLLFNLTSLTPTLGASGAIAGVLGAYTLEHPRAKVVMVMPLGVVPFVWSFPAPVFTGLWFFFQLMSGAASLKVPEPGAGIAWWAHVGGFLAGLALFRLARPPRRLPAVVDGAPAPPPVRARSPIPKTGRRPPGEQPGGPA